ncbi:MAG TPA: BON domain-containing protein [Bryobacteraceae bacterium]|jgi:osmotically-inducible protein OsmY|nr:BON domain-containing protein [Bryobacteraceae bacterium]
MRNFLLILCSAAALLSISCRTNESPEKQVDDVEITAQVKSKLASDVGLSSVTNISVNSTNGVVTLSGQVDTAARKAKAEAAAKSVPKVVRVIDNLQVASSALLPSPGLYPFVGTTQPSRAS